MKHTIVFISVTVTAIVALTLPFSQEMAVMECKTRFTVPKSDIDLIQNRKLPASREGKCMMACILKKMKVMTKRGQFDLRSVKKWLRSKYKDDAAKLTTASMIAEECAKDLLPTIGMDECDMAVQIMQCTKKKGYLAKKAASRK